MTVTAITRIRRRETTTADAARLALCVAVAALAGVVVVVVAAVVSLALAPQARGWLPYTFRAEPTDASEATAIFANNAWALLGVVGLLWIAQLAARTPRGPSSVQRAVRTGGELVLAGVVAHNVVVVGAAVGAYHMRMVRAMLPHGPVELAAYTLALGLYLQGRWRALPVAQIVGTLAASIGLLAIRRGSGGVLMTLVRILTVALAVACAYVRGVGLVGEIARGTSSPDVMAAHLVLLTAGVVGVELCM